MCHQASLRKNVRNRSNDVFELESIALGVNV